MALPAYTANLVHQLYTTKNGESYPPINTRGTAQGQMLPTSSCFCRRWFSSAIFCMWTNRVAKTNQQSTYLDLYALTPQSLHEPNIEKYYFDLAATYTPINKCLYFLWAPFCRYFCHMNILSEIFVTRCGLQINITNLQS